MTRAASSLLAVLVAPLACLAAAAAPQTFRSGVDGVVIPVSVRSGNKPVAGLTAADFQLRDNGVPQQLEDVSAENIPIDLTLLLDLSSSVDGPLLQRLKQAVTDTAALLRGGDRMRLVAVSQALREIFGFRAKGAAMPLDDLSAEGATSLYDGLAVTMMHAAEPRRRQLIVAFTDGRDSTSVVDESGAAAIARQSEAVVDIVVPVAARPEGTRRLTQRAGIDSLTGAGNLAGVPITAGPPAGAVPDEVPPTLSDIVVPTGGHVLTLTPGDSISRVFRTMLDEFRAAYVLQYVPRGVGPGGWHDVDVSVKRRGRFEVRARKGYQGRDTIPGTGGAR